MGISTFTWLDKAGINKGRIVAVVLRLRSLFNSTVIATVNNIVINPLGALAINPVGTEMD